MHNYPSSVTNGTFHETASLTERTKKKNRNIFCRVLTAWNNTNRLNEGQVEFPLTLCQKRQKSLNLVSLLWRAWAPYEIIHQNLSLEMAFNKKHKHSKYKKNWKDKHYLKGSYYIYTWFEYQRISSGKTSCTTTRK